MMGLTGTAILLGGVVYALAVMKAQNEVFVPPPETQFVVDVPPPPPVEEKIPEVAPKVDVAAPPAIEIPEFIVEAPPIIDAPVVPMVENAPPLPPVADPAPVAPAAVGPPATRPRLRGGDKPAYPPSAQRAGESGTTQLTLCVSAQGRVTQASIAGSSGSRALDEAALRWIRNERFTPGTQNGQPTDMCNHNMAYVWELPRN
jgi:protein TonB